jgi:hypothetical protein
VDDAAEFDRVRVRGVAELERGLGVAVAEDDEVSKETLLLVVMVLTILRKETVGKLVNR